LLQKCHLNIDIGNKKNVNKNPIVDRAVQEVEEELLKLEPGGGAVTNTTLALATASVNSKIRKRGLSAREMLIQRDQFTNTQMPISDLDLLTRQYEAKLTNHQYSEVSKAPRGKYHPIDHTVKRGDLVYLYNDRNKSRARDRYLVVSVVDSTWCYLKKIVGNQLRNSAYKVKLSTCYKVPHVPDVPLSAIQAEDSPDDEFYMDQLNKELRKSDETVHPPRLPTTPAAISGSDMMDEPQVDIHDRFQPVDIPCDSPDSVSLEVECSTTQELDNSETSVNNPPPPRRPKRQRAVPAKYKDFELY
jgi:hypothetical protein